MRGFRTDLGYSGKGGNRDHVGFITDLGYSGRCGNGGNMGNVGFMADLSGYTFTLPTFAV